jgi:hypothetical protein
MTEPAKSTAVVELHPFVENAWCVTYSFPSGAKGLKGPFPSKRSAASWAKGYVADAGNAVGTAGALITATSRETL